MDEFTLDVNNQRYNVTPAFVAGLYSMDDFLKDDVLDIIFLNIHITVNDINLREIEDWAAITNHIDPEFDIDISHDNIEFQNWNPNTQSWSEYIHYYLQTVIEHVSEFTYTIFLYYYDFNRDNNQHYYAAYYFNDLDFLRGMQTLLQWTDGLELTDFVKYIVRNDNQQSMFII